MKDTVLKRINDTYNFIKEFYSEKGIYPTYREIQEKFAYSSLSLLKRDIDLLIDLKKLDRNEHKKFVLRDITTNTTSYGFPLLFASDAVNQVDKLNPDEKELLFLQYEYLKGNYKDVLPKLDKLSDASNDVNVKFGCLITKCCCSLYTGNSQPWKEAFLFLLSFEPKTRRERMGRELCIYFLSTVIGARQNCPKWLKEGRFYGLTKKGFPLAKVTFVTMVLADNKGIKPFLLEPLCSEAVAEGIDICQIYMDLNLAMSYHYGGNDEYVNSHLNAAVESCYKNGWLTPLVELRRGLGSILDPILLKYDSDYIKKIDALSKVLVKGYQEVYSAIVGDNAENRFTIREAEIANYVRLGLSNKEIASKLNLSSETIKYYLSSIYVKANVSSRNELRDLMNNNQN